MKSSKAPIGSVIDHTYLPYCVGFTNCDGYSLIIETQVGLTKADVWRCQICRVSVLTPYGIDPKPTNYILK